MAVLGGLLLLGSAHAQVLLKADYEAEGEKGQPKGWRFIRARGESLGKWDDEHAFGGKRALRLSIPKDANARAHWVHTAHVPIKPNSWYRLSVRIMALNVTGEAYLICYENGGQDPQHWHDSLHIKGTEDWEEYATTFRSREDAKWVSVVCKLRHGTGYAWFDDVVLEETTPGPKATKPGATVRIPPEDDGFALQGMWTPAQWCRGSVMHLVRGHLNPLAIFFWGDKQKAKAPAIIVEATEGLTLRGPVVRGRGPMPEDIRVEPETAEREGKAFRVWRFPIVPELLSGLQEKPRWDMYHHIYADVAPDSPADGELRWRMEVNGELGPEHTLPIRVPAEIPQKLVPPDSFRIYVQHTGALRHPDPVVRERLIEYLNTAGIIGGLAMTFYEPDKAAVDAQYKSLGFDLHTWRFEGYHGSVPDEHRLVDATGERSKSRVCPKSQIERVQPWYDALKAYYRAKLASGPKRLVIDYEPPVFDVCFCERCRRAFAKRFDLPADECLSLPPKELQTKYAKQWGLFRAEQNGAIVKLHCNIIHGIDPEVAVGLCSWRGGQGMADRGADIALFEPEAAFHAPMIYTYGLGFHRAVLETCQRTTRPVLPFIELSDISQPRSLTPAQLRMNLLATGLSGGGGAFMWVGMECLDAGYMKMIGQAVREIDTLRAAVPQSPVGPAASRSADGQAARPTGCLGLVVEPTADTKRTMTVDGEEVEMFADNPLPHVRSHIWGTDDKAMVGLLNYDEMTTRKALVRLAQEGMGSYTVRSGLPGEPREERMSADALRRGVTVEIPPQGLAALAVSVAE